MQPVFEEVKQQQRKHDEYPNQEQRVHAPQIWQGNIAQVGNFQNPWHDLLVGQTEDYGSAEKSQDARDEIIQFSFAAPGGASTWSVPGEGHARTENQAANEVTHQVCGRRARKLDNTQPAQDEQSWGGNR